MKAVHFGCGTGFFTFAIAKKVGSEGTVFALDVLEEKIEAIKSQAKLNGFLNISATRANLEKKEGSGLAEESADWVFIINMLYQNKNRNRVIAEAKRILKKSGYIFLADWKKEPMPIGPKNENRVSREEIIKMSRKNGLGIIKEMSLGDFHFGAILAKNS
jgi:ubiquinone/menaquinone biosynthesis C-methylase UbiE